MIKIIDTLPQIPALFPNGEFSLEKWESYINSIYPNISGLFISDMEECISSGEYSYEKDFLPIIKNVCNNPELVTLHESFLKVTENLDGRIKESINKEIDADIVLNLGLCNGAGWVTSIDGRNTVLLGVEKILELNWQDINSMIGLVYHELGHVFHMQHCDLEQESPDIAKNFVWQLFTEGVAMYFEQLVVGEKDYFHQDVNGWKNWCDEHTTQIITDFHNDLPTMTRMNQRYFGDWADYQGHGDVGYYLGTRFVHYLTKLFSFEQIVCLTIDKVYDLYLVFIKQYC